MVNPGGHRDRKTARFSCHVPIAYKMAGEPDGAMRDAVAIDMSAGGLMFESPYDVPENSVLDIIIKLSDYPTPISVKGKVVRIIKSGETPLLKIALNFTNISPVDKEKINLWYYKEMLRF